MIHTAQVVNATSQVIATNMSDAGLGAAPAGMTFVVYDEALVGDPMNKFYVNGVFQSEAP